jgi:hypothetical protein
MNITRTLALAVLLTPLFAANDEITLTLSDSVAYGLYPTLLPIRPQIGGALVALQLVSGISFQWWALAVGLTV